MPGSPASKRRQCGINLTGKPGLLSNGLGHFPNFQGLALGYLMVQVPRISTARQGVVMAQCAPELTRIAPFADGGVYEGSATTAFAGYLREILGLHGAKLTLFRGKYMGMRLRLHAEHPAEPGSAIRVSGKALLM